MDLLNSKFKNVTYVTKLSSMMYQRMSRVRTEVRGAFKF